MKKKQIEHLVLQSYSGGNLDIKSVEKLISQISRRDLKMYIRALKNWENKHSVEIFVPEEKYKNYLKSGTIKKLFPKKKVKFDTDPSLIMGVRIISEDLIYDFDLKDTLEGLVEHIRQQYD